MGELAEMSQNMERVIHLNAANEGIVIRLAQPDDVEQLLDIGDEVFADGHPALIRGFERDKARKYVEWLLHQNSAFCLVAEKDGLILGGLAGIMLPDFFSTEVAGNEMFFGIRESHRSIALAHDMIRVFVQVCFELGATNVRFNPSTDPKWSRYRGFLAKMGFVERAVTMEYRPSSERN
jgi:hypothetical protein